MERGLVNDFSRLKVEDVDFFESTRFYMIVHFKFESFIFNELFHWYIQSQNWFRVVPLECALN